MRYSYDRDCRKEDKFVVFDSVPATHALEASQVVVKTEA